jgi:hypothetical protein
MAMFPYNTGEDLSSDEVILRFVTFGRIQTTRVSNTIDIPSYACTDDRFPSLVIGNNARMVFPVSDKPDDPFATIPSEYSAKAGYCRTPTFYFGLDKVKGLRIVIGYGLSFLTSY